MTELELWSIQDAALFLGAASTGSARRTLSRWGVAAVRHEPGPSGRVEARYDAAQVRQAAASRPRRGAGTNLRA